MSLTRFPRCYNICQPDDMEAFVDDFRLTACLNTLKWLVEVVDRDGANAVQSPQGKVLSLSKQCRQLCLLETAGAGAGRGEHSKGERRGV